MPEAFQTVTYAVPLRYYAQILRGIFLPKPWHPVGNCGR
jgi:hypothetical protein